VGLRCRQNKKTQSPVPLLLLSCWGPPPTSLLDAASVIKVWRQGMTAKFNSLTRRSHCLGPSEVLRQGWIPAMYSVAQTVLLLSLLRLPWPTQTISPSLQQPWLPSHHPGASQHNPEGRSEGCALCSDGSLGAGQRVRTGQDEKGAKMQFSPRGAKQ
jgi:hypothetical protein